MPDDAINLTSPAAVVRATEARRQQARSSVPEQPAAAPQAPVDRAEISPQARKLAAQEERTEQPGAPERIAEERRTPERQQAQQQQLQAATQQRFEVVA